MGTKVTSHFAVKSVSKLLGIKRSDIKNMLPLRAKRMHSRLEPYKFTLSALPTKEELKAAAKEARRLARLEDEDREEKRQRELLREMFKEWVYAAHRLFWDEYSFATYSKCLLRVVMDLYSSLKYEGFNPTVLIGELIDKGKQIGDVLVVKQSGFYLDVLDNEVRDASEWTADGGVTVSLYGELYTRYDKRNLHWWLGLDTPPEGAKVTVEELDEEEPVKAAAAAVGSVGHTACFQTAAQRNWKDILQSKENK